LTAKLSLWTRLLTKSFLKRKRGCLFLFPIKSDFLKKSDRGPDLTGFCPKPVRSLGAKKSDFLNLVLVTFKRLGIKIHNLFFFSRSSLSKKPPLTLTLSHGARENGLKNDVKVRPTHL
jgi:hypothetical protein